MDQINYRGLDIPCESLGGIMTTDCLFGPNEQVVFDFYEANKDRYKRAVDVGANIGVHTILMARQGWEVCAVEPDPRLFEWLKKNLEAHGAEASKVCAAMSNDFSEMKFVRVLNNLTASHLVGAKDSYGLRELILVTTLPAQPFFVWADFVKMDCEGHEAVIIGSLPPQIWDDTDALIEVGNTRTAGRIYTLLIDVVSMWSQKCDWRRVEALADMPTCHQDGSLFIGREPPFRGKT